jgi:uncharacterized protein (TIGR02996 family)
MERTALLANILENPEDDAPRLVYSDWLEENNQGARAEFIRTQCELARKKERERGYDSLKKKEKKLLRQHEAAFKEELPEWARASAVFRRGFSAAVTCGVNTFVSQGADLVAVTPLESLSHSVSDVGDQGAQALAKCPHAARLTDLDLGFTGVKAKGLKALAASPYLTRIRNLRLHNNAAGDKGAAALAATKTMTGLKRLYIDGNGLGLPGLKALQGAPWRLEELDLSNTDFTPEMAAFLGGMSSLSSLRALGLSNSAVNGGVAEALASATQLTNLEVLRLDNNRGLDAAGVRALANSPAFANLTELHLQFCDLDDEAGLALARSPRLAKLKVLVIHCNNLSQDVDQELKERFA